jgi:hypothetical protein
VNFLRCYVPDYMHMPISSYNKLPLRNDNILSRYYVVVAGAPGYPDYLSLSAYMPLASFASQRNLLAAGDQASVPPSTDSRKHCTHF